MAGGSAETLVMEARCGRNLPGETQEAREGVLEAGGSRGKPGEAGAEGRARGPLREAGSVLCPAEAVRPPHRVDSGPGGMGTGRGRVLHGADF